MDLMRFQTSKTGESSFLLISIILLISKCNIGDNVSNKCGERMPKDENGLVDNVLKSVDLHSSRAAILKLGIGTCM